MVRRIKFMRVSLQSKIIFGILLISLLIFGLMDFVLVSYQRNLLISNFKKEALSLTQAISASIESENTLYQSEFLQNNIYKLMWLNPDIVEINISAREDNQLKIVASNNPEFLQKNPDQMNFYVLETKSPLSEIKKIDKKELLFSVAPIYSGGRIIGTCEVIFSLVGINKILRNIFWYFLCLTSFGMILVIVNLFFLIRVMVLRPLFLVKNAIEKLALGDLRIKIERYPKDEIGDLAKGFNQMAEILAQRNAELYKLNQKLQNAYERAKKELEEKTTELEREREILERKVKERTKELEELKENLEKKVQERTKELQERIKDLETMQKVLIGRELRIIELKKEIDRLRQQLKEKNG